VFCAIIFIIVMTFIFLSKIKFSYNKFECNVDKLVSSEKAVNEGCKGNINATLILNVSFIVYTIGFLCFLGWFFLAFYVGMGFIALPMDFIIAYLDRPKKLTSADLSKITPKLLNLTTKMIRDGEELKRKYAAERKFNKVDIKMINQISEFESAVNAMEEVIVFII